jgi:hypothetical protein
MPYSQTQNNISSVYSDVPNHTSHNVGNYQTWYELDNHYQSTTFVLVCLYGAMRDERFVFPVSMRCCVIADGRASWGPTAVLLSPTTATSCLSPTCDLTPSPGVWPHPTSPFTSLPFITYCTWSPISCQSNQNQIKVYWPCTQFIILRSCRM